MSVAPRIDPVRTTCPYCGVGCGVMADARRQGGAAIRGDPDHPANRGRLCSKGAALGETLGLGGPAAAPEIDGAPRRLGRRRSTRSPRRFAATIAAHGPDAVAFYVSGQLLTEDYYVANKLMKGFIGTANIDTNSRLCMASAVAGHKRAFGERHGAGLLRGPRPGRPRRARRHQPRLVPSGAVPAHRSRQRERAGMQLVVIDPRRTETCDIADLHLALEARQRRRAVQRPAGLARPSTASSISASSTRTPPGFEAALWRRARDRRPARRRRRDRPAPSATSQPFYDWFAATERTVTLYSPGRQPVVRRAPTRSTRIINCHLATGRIGKPGMGPFSITGQPNAMGGREVGGLANHARRAHGLRRPGRCATACAASGTRRAWRRGPGLKAVDLFEAVADGRIKALWIMAHQSGRQPAARRRACARRCDSCQFVVVSGLSAPHRHRARFAHVAAAGRSAGARRTAPSPTPSAASRASAPSCRAGRSAPRLVDDAPRSRAAWASARRFAYESRRATSSASMPLCRPSRTTARRDFDIGGLADIDDARLRRASPRCNGPCRGDARGGEPPLRRWPLLRRRTAGALRRDRRAAPPAAVPERAAALCSTPAACATSGTP